MGQVNYTMTQVKRNVKKITWQHLTTTNPGGQWADFPDYPDKTVRVYGTFGASAAIVMKAPGDTAADYAQASDVTLNDSRGEGNPAIIGDANALVLNENPERVAPVLTNGDGNTDITVVMTCVGP